MSFISFTGTIKLAVFAGLGVGFLWTISGYAQDTADPENFSAKEDYITCWKQPCVYVEGSIWSEQNPNGIAVSVRMGIEPVASDEQIKTILIRDFKHYGITNIKFFFEQNDVLSSAISFHIRGGTEGPYFVTEVRELIPQLSSRAANKEPLFGINQ